MKNTHDMKVQMVPIDQITVVNARSRGQSKFKQIISNISHIGLKKPITLARRVDKDGKVTYDLVCGQGRLEAFIALGQKEVPAMIVDVTQEELMLMSLAENMARRQRTSIEMAREILALHERGDSIPAIAEKVDLDVSYVRGMIRLLKNGEERLLRAVEQRRIPLSMAISISESDDQEVQQLMAEAYEKKELRGSALLAARKLLEQRKNEGRAMYQRARNGEALPANPLIRVYKKETAKLQLMTKRAAQTETRLGFITSAFRKLFADPAFIEVLKSESFESLPHFLAEQVGAKGGSRGKQAS